MRTFAQKPSASQVLGSSYLARSHTFTAALNHQTSLTPLGRQTNLGVQRLVKARADSTGIHPKLTVSSPGDQFEEEADRVAEQVMRMPEPHLQRACACGGECPECRKEHSGRQEVQRLRLQAQDTGETAAPPIVGEVLASPGLPLSPAARAFMEPRFGHDFSRVRVHTDARAAESARAVQAKAYTVGRRIVFGEGQYGSTDESRRLLAHELTHVVQQSSSGGLAKDTSTDDEASASEGQAALNATSLHRSVVSVGETEEPQVSEIGEKPQLGGRGSRRPDSFVPELLLPPAAVLPENCPPPKDMYCPAAVDSPGTVTNELTFPVDSATLNAKQRTEVAAVAASWHAAGGSVDVRVDGYASAEGRCEYNWSLSCRRAQAVAAELASPSDGSPGVAASNLELFAHGESAEAGLALAPNRQATISIPTAPPPPGTTPSSCALPVLLGSGRSSGRTCGTGTDFEHFDFPSISALSEAKLAAWAALRNSSRIPSRSLVSDVDCMTEMGAVLGGLAGGPGLDAFSRFVAGTGGTDTHGPGRPLGALALVSPEFTSTVASVKSAIEAQLATQASGGALDPCALAVTPPPTFFASRHFYAPGALKSVIGGTHGEELFATGFTGNIPLRTYSIDLRFLICDNFGVDENDLYAPGLFPFWVLQHERSATLYAPFINELDLPVTVSGTF
jgi:outer membrane protein OmpA-like peptidoglycan-associated protein